MADHNVIPIHGRVPKPAEEEALITMFTDNPRVIFRDRAVLDDLLREAKVEAWDEGYQARRSENHLSPGESNPYQKDSANE